jgi:hypothetical protein
MHGFLCRYHTLLGKSTWKLTVMFIALYVFVITIFGSLFWALQTRENHDRWGCNMEMETFQDAWVFSLETIMTIGYGAPPNMSVYMEECWTVVTIITLESMAGLVCSAWLIGTMFQVIARDCTRP